MPKRPFALNWGLLLSFAYVYFGVSLAHAAWDDRHREALDRLVILAQRASVDDIHHSTLPQSYYMDFILTLAHLMKASVSLPSFDPESGILYILSAEHPPGATIDSILGNHRADFVPILDSDIPEFPNADHLKAFIAQGDTYFTSCFFFLCVCKSKGLKDSRVSGSADPQVLVSSAASRPLFGDPFLSSSADTPELGEPSLDVSAQSPSIPTIPGGSSRPSPGLFSVSL